MTIIWLVLLIFVLAWYAGITLYVAVRGAADIKSMLRELGDRDQPRD